MRADVLNENVTVAIFSAAQLCNQPLQIFRNRLCSSTRPSRSTAALAASLCGKQDAVRRILLPQDDRLFTWVAVGLIHHGRVPARLCQKRDDLGVEIRRLINFMRKTRRSTSHLGGGGGGGGQWRENKKSSPPSICRSARFKSPPSVTLASNTATGPGGGTRQGDLLRNTEFPLVEFALSPSWLIPSFAKAILL